MKNAWRSWCIKNDHKYWPLVYCATAISSILVVQAVKYSAAYTALTFLVTVLLMVTEFVAGMSHIDIHFGHLYDNLDRMRTISQRFHNMLRKNAGACERDAWMSALSWFSDEYGRMLDAREYRDDRLVDGFEKSVQLRLEVVGRKIGRKIELSLEK